MRTVILVAPHHVDCVANNCKGRYGSWERERATGLPKPGLLDVDLDTSQWVEVLVKATTCEDGHWRFPTDRCEGGTSCGQRGDSVGNNPLFSLLIKHIAIGSDPAGPRSTADQNDLPPDLTKSELNDWGKGKGGAPFIVGDAVSIDGALDVFICCTGASEATSCVEIAANNCGVDVEHRSGEAGNFFELEAGSGGKEVNLYQGE